MTITVTNVHSMEFGDYTPPRNAGRQKPVAKTNNLPRAIQLAQFANDGIHRKVNANIKRAGNLLAGNPFTT